ncbi:hypothetical protein GCM10011571_09460 [Marinithermofilum abyssi]|uniref:AraC family transcriptional regulator n=1 Tax=Marinithermofilum abyssi TaxID=1571185 RepID=A0A8J2YCP0_9BACL|nr:CD1247 N-terminal domain-containing protein [Marinithermofilum abyssi]GGE10253.1 hypothetical protein GCM10011571_09460 [Marinithermofilum abyssi]
MELDQLRRDLAYIRGMAEGSPDLARKGEGQLVLRLLDVIDQLTEQNQHLEVRLNELEEYVEAVDEDLNELELLIYDDEEMGEFDEEDEDVGYWEMECPHCRSSVLVDEEDMLDDGVTEILCPECQGVLLGTNGEGGAVEAKQWEAPESKADTVGDEASRH